MKVLLLVGATVGVWLVAALVAVAVDGSHHWLPSGVAMGLCLVPAAATLTLLRFTEYRSPAVALGAVLVAPILRLVVVCAVGLALGATVPDLKAAPLRFAAWVLAFYLLTLIVETVLAVPRKKQPRAGAAGSA